ncbi:MAG: aminotransferase class IV [Leptospirillia bacterium]
MSERVYLNGDMVAADAARISVFDRGFLYGDGVFETVRSYAGRVFRADDHFARMAAGAACLGFALPFDAAGFGRIVERCLMENRMEDGIVRLTVSRGEGTPLPAPRSADGKPTVVGLVRPVAGHDPEAWAKGIRVVISNRRSQPADVLDPAVKSTCFLPGLLALGEARAAGADEAIRLNHAGEVAEGSVSNLFAVQNGGLITPPLSAGILDGVTRRVVLELARQAGIDAQEAALRPDDLSAADEVFVTNTGWELMPVSEIDGHPVADGRAGKMTRRLFEDFRMCTGVSSATATA